MKRMQRFVRAQAIPILALIFTTGLSGCGKKTDQAAANTGGGAAVKRNIITIMGADR